MAALKLETSWEEVKELLKEINHHLTDEDLEYDPANENELLERLSAKVNMTTAEVKNWIESVSFNKGKAG